MIKFTRTLVLITVFCLPFAESGAYEEPDIIVTATRSEQEQILVPAGMIVIGREELLSSGAVNITDVLRGRGGLQMIDLFGDGSGATVDVRGFGESAGSNNLVMIDGRPLNNTDIAAPDLGSIALVDVERVEVLQGSAGALYGDQAVSGVINIITRRPEEFDAAVTVLGGSYNRSGLRARLSDLLDSSFSYRLSAERINSDNYRVHNELEFSSIMGRVDYSYDSGMIFFEMQSLRRELETPGALLESEAQADRRQSLPVFANDYTHTDADTARAGLRQHFGDHWQFAAEYTDAKSEAEFITSFRTFQVTEPDTRIREQKTWTPRFLGEYSTDNGILLLTAGVDLIETDIDALVQNRQQIRSTYLQAVVPVGSRVSYTVAGRRAEVENVLTDPFAFPDGQNIDDTARVASLGFNFTPKDGWRMYARADGNFRFAKADEQNFTETGTIGLDTQKGLSKEIGGEWLLQGGHSIKLAAYRLDLEGEIAFDPTVDGPFGPATGANVNLDDTQRQGYILEGRYAFATDLILAAAWRSTDAEFRSGAFEGNTVSGVAEEVKWLSIDYRIGDHWQAYLEMQDFGEQYLNGDNANLLDKKGGYTVAHANLAWLMREWRLSMRINNITDKKYIESANAFGAVNPSPERNIWISTEYRFE